MRYFYLYLTACCVSGFFYSPALIGQCTAFLHDNSASTSWLSCVATQNPVTSYGNTHWIQYDFQGIYQLDSTHFWNYNDSIDTQSGMQTYMVDYSLDGLVWNHLGTFILAQASGEKTYAGDPGPDFDGIQARFVLITAASNYGGNCTGFSEIYIGLTDPGACLSLDMTADVVPISCPGAQNGEIALSPAGGTPPYSYAWTDGSEDAARQDLDQGIYGITLVDGAGCMLAMVIEMEEPTADPEIYDSIPVPSDEYYDGAEIMSTGLIAYDGEVSFSSATGIRLDPAFEVVSGGAFYMIIEPCISGSELPSPVTHHWQSGFLEQAYSDYLGAGHHLNISTLASHEEGMGYAFNTLGGKGWAPDEVQASRFLGQATMGADTSDIDRVRQMGYTGWIDWQLTVPHQSYKEAFDTVVALTYDTSDNNNFTEFPYFRMAWWQNVMTGEDYLRDRVGFALSEIFVVSDKSDLAVLGEGLASYYDCLHRNALGNFRDLLLEVTLHPSMGLYLSHLNNPKSDTAVNQYPDENYAREVMQLFTIGLLQLADDGSQLKNYYGQSIPTYGNAEVIEFAKIFTGLGFDAPGAQFGSRRFYDFTVPMIMYEDFHEPGEKYLLNGQLVPDGQTGMEDIEDAVDNLFNHPNVGPFIARRLIQRLVKSNPSYEYIRRVSDTFADNGFGIRGDLGAVVRSILMDPEARDCWWIDQPDAGKLREPLVRYTHFLNAFHAYSQSGKFYSIGNVFYENTLQAPLAAPSVFNFYIPDYIPPGPAGEQLLFGPEFQILNSHTSLGFFNIVNGWKDNRNVLPSLYDTVYVDFTEITDLALDGEQLIDRLDLLLTHGSLDQQSKNVFLDALAALPPEPEVRAKLALYLMMTSPSYSIQK